ncbi:arginine decarboxylase [Solemya velum gill symbiont]|uniref:Arginine decarboxylase n=1 Tax=Solemya velum gill symbiont TaxID=2340 RepID=A0A1T2DHW2_SOVGS|nr:biosynthetic arginine decarboxylase [Solemya velum gill symbiont]OOY36258.1 arginine decarboxylase [Solemya velum gill symbiont]OOY40846.1 arginine decarboxylase [Solemya velum gill symbiont]OOY46626.1 arginine decarboxylase [Solemya velum gill symbiont]OOY47918.1 arginine decarboxylase [Solemya velum gill symbiont]OOY50860.1 arginine decarboxylase [Solemya velum gill symbiont]
MQNESEKNQHYGVTRWGNGYFSISATGQLETHLDGHRQALVEIAASARDKQLDLPLLVRFPGILRHRARSLCETFSAVAHEADYKGNYQCIYPIKVNQQRTVIEQIVTGGKGCVGLEAGSKPELMAVMALSEKGSVIVCNGYKDREYIRLALIGRALGLQLYIVIEKASELQLIEEESASLGVEPLLGVRVRLAASASGNWQNSGGEKAKFGLTATQLITLVEQLKSNGHLHWLQLLHSHIGSQIPNLRDIAKGVNEASRYYAELRNLGADIKIVDVGGGLGIDYEGTASRHYCSINYTLENYARTIIESIQNSCRNNDVPEPDIFTESGRALTAHHAVLITNIIDSDPIASDSKTLPVMEVCSAITKLSGLQQQIDSLSPNEIHEEARYLLDESLTLFENGEINLQQWSHAEQLYIKLCQLIRPRLRAERRRDRDLLDRLNLQLADKLFINFSLFQSTPDVWAIDQIFPIMPLTRLNEEPQRNAILHDLTCDSDGCISSYVDADGIESTLPLHTTDESHYLLGIFLVGAYQEILGDMHNLFGDTHAINVEVTVDGFEITEIEKGDAIDELLEYVHFDPQKMLNRYEKLLENANLDANTRSAWLEELSSGLTGYSYHEM